jgi:glycosyltransferase involved in cell wall biosynthesis
MPLVSICIPAYNAESTIAETLDTVLAQDYPCLDIVVSDNQSTDNTKSIVQEYANHGVRYVYHSEGRPDWAAKMSKYIGGFANWNYVLSQGHGDYLCLFHSDDLYEPSIVRKQVLVMQENPQVGAVFTMLRAIGEDGKPSRFGKTYLPLELHGRQVFEFNELFNAILKYFNFLPSPSVMIRRKAFEEIKGFNERQFFTSADLEMWLRIACHYDIGIINEPLLNYRLSEKQFGSQYHNLRTKTWDYFLVIDHFLSQPEIRKYVNKTSISFNEMYRASDHVKCAMHLLLIKQAKEAKIMLKRALKFRHFSPAVQRPRKLAILLLGYLLRWSICLGVGPLAGQGLYRAHQFYLQWRRKPFNG